MLARSAKVFARLTLVPGLLVLGLAAPAVAGPQAAPAPARTYWGMPTGNPAIAAGLSLAVSGWGQHYNGEPEKGNMMLATLLAFPVAYGVDALSGGAIMRTFTFVVLTGVKGWSVYDAYQGARAPRASLPPAANVAP